MYNIIQIRKYLLAFIQGKDQDISTFIQELSLILAILNIIL